MVQKIQLQSWKLKFRIFVQLRTNVRKFGFQLCSWIVWNIKRSDFKHKTDLLKRRGTFGKISFICHSMICEHLKNSGGKSLSGFCWSRKTTVTNVTQKTYRKNILNEISNIILQFLWKILQFSLALFLKVFSLKVFDQISVMSQSF